MGATTAGSFAELIANMIDLQDFDEINPGDEGTPAYENLKAQLERFHTNEEIAYIYLLKKIDGQYYYIVVSGEGAIEEISEVEDDFVPEVEDAAQGKNLIREFIDRTEDGDVISAYAPILDEKGNSIGVVGVDYNAVGIERRIYAVYGLIVIIGVIMLIVSVIFANFLAAGIVRGIRKINEKIQELVKNNGDLTKTIDITTNDEVGDVAGSINELLVYIRDIVRSIYASSNTLTENVQKALETTSEARDGVSNVSSTMEEMSAAIEETTASIS